MLFLQKCCFIPLCYVRSLYVGFPEAQSRYWEMSVFLCQGTKPKPLFCSPSTLSHLCRGIGGKFTSHHKRTTCNTVPPIFPSHQDTPREWTIHAKQTDPAHCRPGFSGQLCVGFFCAIQIRYLSLQTIGVCINQFIQSLRNLVTERV